MGNMMSNMGGFGWGMGSFGWVFMLLFWGLVIVAIVALVKWLIGQSTNPGTPDQHTAIEILQKRYACGEINTEEYKQTKRQLQL